jgi:hypothetical protein
MNILAQPMRARACHELHVHAHGRYLTLCVQHVLARVAWLPGMFRCGVCMCKCALVGVVLFAYVTMKPECDPP